ILSINLSSAFQTIKASIAVMKQQKFGRIINIASAHAKIASPFKSAYISAKHGIVGLTKTVALEASKESITCNAICPGYVLTELVERQIAEQAIVHQMQTKDVIDKIMLKSQPIGRFVSPEEVAALAVFLASEWAGAITGSAIDIDGGWTAQ
ncbi:MAG: SDR family oxidoreductase, partial [Pseudomonadota bacterium]